MVITKHCSGQAAECGVIRKNGKSMPNDEIVVLVDELLKIFGGVTIVCVGLITWIGVLFQQRILQKEQHKLSETLQKLQNELELEKSSYEHYLELIMNYYSTYYDHYRLCQHACEADAIKNPDGSITNTKITFDSQLDEFLKKWSAQEGKIRLLLPAEILSTHEESIKAFNEVRAAVNKFKNSNETRAVKLAAFENLHRVKNEMEKLLRAFLRTESLLK